MIQTIIDYFFSYPKVSDFFRSILENKFVVTKRLIRKELDCSKKTLDIGCGSGMFSELFDDYVGIDISPKNINHARKKYKKELHVMDAIKLRFKSNAFDNVLVVGMFHHLDDPSFLKVVSEIKRILKRSGKALIFEDIPTRSKYNFTGKLIHFFDLGKSIRKTGDYEKLLGKRLKIQKTYNIRSGVCDYAVFLCLKE